MEDIIMKISLIYAFIVLTIGLFCCLVYSDESKAPATATSMPITVFPLGDAATDLVASFYKILVQENPPTLKQETDLFVTSSAMRTSLAARRKVAAADPIVLQFFREHKEWFLPANMKSFDEIMISSSAHFIRSVERAKQQPENGAGFVIVLVYDKNDHRQVIRTRTIVFQMAGGKIDPAVIYLDGFGGESTLEMVLKK